MELIGHGHSCIKIRLNDGTNLLLDPFINGGPLADVSLVDLYPDYILITHGHSDHIGSMLAIAQANKATIIAMAEVAMYAQSQGVKAHGMSLGRRCVFPFGSVKFVLALHSSGYEIDDAMIHMGEASGIILEAEDRKIYHAGDAALFSDMRLLAEDRSIDVAFLPIGDNYTMGPEDALEAIAYLNPEIAIPIHYNTFPVIQQNPAIFVEQVVGGKALNLGETVLVQEEVMATKHDQVLKHIEDLPIDDRISVRSIAKSLSVSEETTYRAVKDAENIGLVSTIRRVGMIRIERKSKKHIGKLTFGEVVRIIEGGVLGGSSGLDKVLNKFVIGAMTETTMTRYVTPGSLVIVDNRQSVQKLALENGVAVLITGGFETSEEIAQLADRLGMPVLRTIYDTFAVAIMIDRVLSDQLVKKGIPLVSDIYAAFRKTNYLLTTQTIADYQALSKSAHHSRFPAVNKKLRLVGIVAAKDVISKSEYLTVDKVMTKDPNAVKKTMSVASASHQMIWDGLEVMLVVEDDLALVGIVSRQDVMKAMQSVQRQPQIADTISDQISGEVMPVGENGKETTRFRLSVTPQMVNSVGTISFDVLSEIISNITQRTMLMNQKRSVLIKQVNLYYLRLIQLENELNIRSWILEIDRRSARSGIEVYLENVIVAKAIVVCQVMERT